MSLIIISKENTIMTTNCLRTRRLFDQSSGRSFMVALDRTLGVGVEPFTESPGTLIQSVIEGGADAMLLSPGLIKQFGMLAAFHGGPALVARIDYPFMYESTQGKGEEFRLIASVEEVVALGADAVVMFLTTLVEERRVFADNAAAVGRVARECRRLGIPLIVEAVPWGKASTDHHDPATVIQSARIAAELGADIVKTENLDDAEQMHRLVTSCPVPVLMLGGPSLPLDQLLERTSRGLASGAKGVVFGRNAWQRTDAAEAMSALRALVHEG
ncbi:MULTISPECIES: class I fructose-bisphosphate aldolase [unclassified Actinomyces]|uniref:class I fructose-bisphosphate aldolase n=1 Tax=unclassified Actinomyces TaxID=2609248 RepID=UPI000D58F506|nr:MULTISPECIES: hypothetical protein [unclassified Actinomyces]RAX20464.1 hypothetical protein DRB07_13950 [Actinomyces sp. Z3]